MLTRLNEPDLAPMTCRLVRDAVVTKLRVCQLHCVSMLFDSYISPTTTHATLHSCVFSYWKSVRGGAGCTMQPFSTCVKCRTARLANFWWRYCGEEIHTGWNQWGAVAERSMLVSGRFGRPTTTLRRPRVKVRPSSCIVIKSTHGHCLQTDMEVAW